MRGYSGGSSSAVLIYCTTWAPQHWLEGATSRGESLWVIQAFAFLRGLAAKEKTSAHCADDHGLGIGQRPIKRHLVTVGAKPAYERFSFSLPNY